MVVEQLEKVVVGGEAERLISIKVGAKWVAGLPGRGLRYIITPVEVDERYVISERVDNGVIRLCDWVQATERKMDNFVGKFTSKIPYARTSPRNFNN